MHNIIHIHHIPYNQKSKACPLSKMHFNNTPHNFYPTFMSENEL